jgi:hypothetical protein
MLSIIGRPGGTEDLMSDGAHPEQSGDKPVGSEKGQADKTASKASATNFFVLEGVFPDAAAAFSTAIVPPIDQCDALVVIDTNALLLPYKLTSGDLASLKETYKALAAQRRLFIPARVAREFISNRDARLTELLQGLLNDSSKTSAAAKPLPPHLRSVPGHDELMEAGKQLDAARKAYQKAVGKVRGAVEAWRGNDPVTTVYADLFNATNIVEHGGDQDSIGKEWAIRLRDRVPPGFKDGSKPDTGIGDFLIWKSILLLGKQHKKDLVFVTGEEKTDWMVRFNKEGIYPRPELIAQYRRESGGRAIRLSSLAHVLEEMKAPAEVVKEVKVAEHSANAEIRATAAMIVSARVVSRHPSAGEKSFDYSTDDGNLTISTNNGVFDLRFTKASDAQIYLIKTGNTARIARAKSLRPGDVILIDNFDSSSSTYTIGLGEVFLVENAASELLVGRIAHIADDTRNNAPADEVRFIYTAWPKGTLAVAP